MSVEIGSLPTLGAAPATNDQIVMSDVSDVSGGADGTVKTMTVANAFTSPSISNPTLTGTTTAAAITASGAVSAASIATTGAANIGGALTSSGVVSSGGVTSSAATGPGVGYATGAGGAVTQTGGITTGVTLNKLSGQITTVANGFGGASITRFTVTNSTVAATDTILVSIKSGFQNFLCITVTAVAAGSFELGIANVGSATSTSTTLVINFSVIKAVAA